MSREGGIMEKARGRRKKEKVQLKNKNFRFVIDSSLFLIFAFIIFNFVGCASLTETAKGIAGVSTKILEETRKDAIKKTFNYDFDTCYNQAKEILTKIGAYTYAKDKDMIAVYLSEEDTTPIGIFFKGIDSANTQIEVSSPSSFAKEFVSGKLFCALDESLKPKKEDVQTDAR
jgi:hypothetical protein